MALCAQLVLTLSLRDMGIVHVYSSDTGPGLASLRYTQSHDFRVKPLVPALYEPSLPSFRPGVF